MSLSKTLLPLLSQSSRKCQIRRISMPTFGFVCVHFPAGDFNLRQFFSADASQTH